MTGSKKFNWDDQLDLAFLRDFAAFGVYNHFLMAQIIVKAIQNSNGHARKIFRVKLYSEFISAIEDFAGLCIAIAGREEMSILGTYLFYGTKFKGRNILGPGPFFDLATKVGSNTKDLLGLPELKTLYQKLDDDTYEIFVNGHQKITSAIGQAAKWYRLENRIAVGAYNKIKHGFVVTQGFSSKPPFFEPSGREAAVLYSKPSMAHGGRLLVNGALIDIEVGIEVELEAIKTLMEASRTLIHLFIILKERQLI